MLTVNTWIIIAVSSVLYVLLKRRLSHGCRYPPGPPSWPVLGHLLSMPTSNQHLVFHEWSKTYGIIIHVSAFGRHTLILNDVKTSVELLDKRGSIYSDRPHLTIADVLNADDLPTIPYGSRFRKHRKLVHARLTKPACVRFLDGQQQNAFILASNLLEHGASGCEDSLNIFASSMITKAVLGYLIASPDDEWIGLMKEHSILQHDVATVGGNLLEFLPFLQHLPAWVPGTGFLRLARSKSWILPRIYEKSYEQAQQQLANSASGLSILSEEISRAIERGTLDDSLVDDLKRMAGAIVRAANDTTASTLHTFLFIMTVCPEIQKRAQVEIDRVVGLDRMPHSDDDLPYVSALIQELLRWNPVVALGVPHQSIEDDVCDGYFIPKGTVVVTNLYGMSRDESVYRDPSAFDPTRFLPSPRGRGEPLFDSAFGFGRRICPGRHFAYNSIWIAVATCLATVNIGRELDEHGKEIIPEPHFSTGVMSSPKPFPFKISPRSANALTMLQAMTGEVLLAKSTAWRRWKLRREADDSKYLAHPGRRGNLYPGLYR